MNLLQEKVILLVEDNPQDEALTLRAFDKNKLYNKIIVTRDGEEALDYLFGTGIYSGRDLQDLPELILLDLKLPKLDGLQVLERIRSEELTKLLPVVILTSSKEEKDVIESYHFGTNSYIQKPVDFNEFSETIRQIGMYWLILNVSPPQCSTL